MIRRNLPQGLFQTLQVSDLCGPISIQKQDPLSSRTQRALRGRGKGRGGWGGPAVRPWSDVEVAGKLTSLTAPPLPRFRAKSSSRTFSTPYLRTNLSASCAVPSGLPSFTTITS